MDTSPPCPSPLPATQAFGADFALEFLKVCPFGRGFKYKKEGDALRSAECLSRLTGLAQPAPVQQPCQQEASRALVASAWALWPRWGGPRGTQGVPARQQADQAPAQPPTGRAGPSSRGSVATQALQARSHGRATTRSQTSALGDHVASFQMTLILHLFLLPASSPKDVRGALQPRRSGHKAAGGGRPRRSGRPSPRSAGVRFRRPARAGPPL